MNGSRLLFSINFAAMYSSIKTYTFSEIRTHIDLQCLQQRLVRVAIMNFLLLATLGVVLRAVPLLPSFGMDYRNLVHAHSHFAFGGWLMPVFLALIMRRFRTITEAVGYTHFRNIAILLLLSSYGMLFTFPFEGYGPFSITFSTISVAGGFYWAFVSWKHLGNTVSNRFLRWGFIYLVVSAIGPFATAPLAAMEMKTSPLYYDSVYFYLHFQYNGFFSFAIFALSFEMLSRKFAMPNGHKVFYYFNSGCILSFFLSVLWHNQSAWFAIAGGAGAVLQAVGLYFLVKDLRLVTFNKHWSMYLYDLALIALFIKILLQLASAFPAVALAAFEHKNLIIGYLHLVLLGFITLFAIGMILQKQPVNRSTQLGLSLFLSAFLVTEALLALSGVLAMYRLSIPYFGLLMMFFSCFFVAGIALMAINVRKLYPRWLQ